MRSGVLPVRNACRRKLKSIPVRICQRDGNELKLAAILAHGFEPPNFLFNDGNRFVIPGKTTDEQNGRRFGRRTCDHSRFDPDATLTETHIPVFGTLQRQTKNQRKYQRASCNRELRIFHVCEALP